MEYIIEEAGKYIHAQFGSNGINGDFFNTELLNEEHGYIPNIDKYVNCITNKLYSRIIKLKSGDVLNTILQEDVFENLNTFFNSCYLLINLKLGDKNSYNCYYDTSKSSFKENDIFVFFKFNIEAKDTQTLLRYLQLNIAHEITHAYEDYKRHTNSSYSLADIGKKSGYFRFNAGKNFSDTAKSLCCIYIKLSKLEIRAIIGQLRTEILSTGKEINGTIDSMNIIRKTEAWKNYEYIYNNIVIINGINDKTFQEELINTFNLYSNKKVKTYDQFKYIFNKRWYKWKNQFLKNLSKIIYDIYEYQNQNRFVDSSESLNDILSKNKI